MGKSRSSFGDRILINLLNLMKLYHKEGDAVSLQADLGVVQKLRDNGFDQDLKRFTCRFQLKQQKG